MSEMLARFRCLLEMPLAWFFSVLQWLYIYFIVLSRVPFDFSCSSEHSALWQVEYWAFQFESLEKWGTQLVLLIWSQLGCACTCGRDMPSEPQKLPERRQVLFTLFGRWRCTKRLALLRRIAQEICGRTWKRSQIIHVTTEMTLLPVLWMHISQFVWD